MRCGPKRIVLAACAFAACSSPNEAVLPQDANFDTEVVAELDSPWAMTFLPDGRLLVTEMEGVLVILDTATGESTLVTGTPEVAFAGQGGFGDVVVHPDFQANGLVYLSYAERGSRGTSGAAVGRARLELDAERPAMSDFEVIWRQEPKVSGTGHYGHRIVFGPDGYLWISSGERQKFDPAQDMGTNLGKIVRLHEDGSVPEDNPFADEGGVTAQIWSLGHRNPLGLAFDRGGQLWNVEMGPSGGDELNRVERGANYGYPIVSHGNHYSGADIPDHDTRPEFHAPAVWWTPVISPSSLIFYDGTQFPEWQGSALIGGLSSESLIRVAFEGDGAYEAERFSMSRRIREVEEGPDGSVWLLEDGRRGGDGRLVRLTARD